MATTAETLRRTNEQPGTRAKLKNLPTSAFKVRQVLDLIRGQEVQRAQEILRFSERGPATPVAKLLASAVANAENNDSLSREELFISACFADEGVTAKRWRPRARGRAGRIRKRSAHVTIIVSRLPEERLEQLRTQQISQEGARRSRVAGSRRNRVAKSQATEALAEEVTDETTTATDVEVPVTEAETPTPSEKNEAAETPATETAETEAAAPSEEAADTMKSAAKEEE